MSEAAATGPNRESPPPGACPYLDPENAPLPKRGWLRRWPGFTFLLPFALFLIVGSQEPSPPAENTALHAAEADGDEPQVVSLDEERERQEAELHAQMPYEYYPYVYSLKIGLTLLAMLIVLPGYLAFPLRLNGIAWIVGAVGAVGWVLLTKLQVWFYPLLPDMLSKTLEMGGRSGFNPLVELKDNPAWAYGFLAIRFFGLVVVVAVIEEFFLRGFLMRYVMDIDWPLIPFGVVNKLALATVIIFPIIYHPERLASAFWFSLVTWMMLRTRNIWDCVVAHGVTNLLMGLWVLYSGDWWMM